MEVQSSALSKKKEQIKDIIKYQYLKQAMGHSSRRGVCSGKNKTPGKR